jgi:NAD-dependent dihydropyrimidine dehydrogenase PreA subunit
LFELEENKKVELQRQNEAAPIQVDVGKCVGCLSCELRCSYRRVKAFSPADADIRVKRLVGSDREFSVSFTENCDNCGICVLHCVYGALTQDKRARATAVES